MKVSHYSLNYEKLELINNEFRLFIDGKITFEKYESFNLYLEDGTFYKSQSVRSQFDLNQKLGVLNNREKTLVQYNYNFYSVPKYTSGDINSIQDLEILLSECLKKNLKIECCDGRLSDSLYLEKNNQYTALKNLSKKRSFDYFYKPFELMATGCTRSIMCVNAKGYVNFNYKEYLKNKNNFIIKNPDLKEKTESLFRLNMGIINSFYMLENESIKKNNFDRLKHSIKRLNVNINNKIKNH